MNLVFGISCDVTKAIRTEPPSGLDGVDSITYTGMYPLAALQVTDSELPVDATLWASSAYGHEDLLSNTNPAITYTLVAKPKPGETFVSKNVSFLFNLPLSIEENQERQGSAGKAVSAATTPQECLHACQADSSCASWYFNQKSSCYLNQDVPLNSYELGSFSGVRGSWQVSSNKNCITLSRPGDGPASGTASLCSVDPTYVNYVFGDTLQEVWQQFESKSWSKATNNTSAYGALVVTAQLDGPGAVELPISFGWDFPNRDHMGVNIGNFYSRSITSAEDAAIGALANQTSDLETMEALHDLFLNSSLPNWLSDSLVNTLSHVRSAWHTADDRMRQWEAYDCVNIDSVHNDGTFCVFLLLALTPLRRTSHSVYHVYSRCVVICY